MNWSGSYIYYYKIGLDNLSKNVLRKITDW